MRFVNFGLIIVALSVIGSCTNKSVAPDTDGEVDRRLRPYPYERQSAKAMSILKMPVINRDRVKFPVSIFLVLRGETRAVSKVELLNGSVYKFSVMKIQRGLGTKTPGLLFFLTGKFTTPEWKNYARIKVAFSDGTHLERQVFPAVQDAGLTSFENLGDLNGLDYSESGAPTHKGLTYTFIKFVDGVSEVSGGDSHSSSFWIENDKTVLGSFISDAPIDVIADGRAIHIAPLSIVGTAHNSVGKFQVAQCRFD